MKDLAFFWIFLHWLTPGVMLAEVSLWWIKSGWEVAEVGLKLALSGWRGLREAEQMINFRLTSATLNPLQANFGQHHPWCQPMQKYSKKSKVILWKMKQGGLRQGELQPEVPLWCTSSWTWFLVIKVGCLVLELVSRPSFVALRWSPP